MGAGAPLTCPEAGHTFESSGNRRGTAQTWSVTIVDIIGFEAQCPACGETFNPAGPDDLTHLETSDGQPCGGVAAQYRSWSATDPSLATDTAEYLARARAAIAAGSADVAPYLRATCTECCEVGRAGDGEHEMAGPYVIVGCEGYRLVNPKVLGLSAPHWQPVDMS